MAWFDRGAADRELDAELRDHIERLTRDHIARGIEPADVAVDFIPRTKGYS